MLVTSISLQSSLVGCNVFWITALHCFLDHVAWAVLLAPSIEGARWLPNTREAAAHLPVLYTSLFAKSDHCYPTANATKCSLASSASTVFPSWQGQRSCFSWMDQCFKPEDSERAELFYLQHDGVPGLVLWRHKCQLNQSCQLNLALSCIGIKRIQ